MTINQASREELLRNAICRICPNVKWICISNQKIKISNQYKVNYIFFIYKIYSCVLIQQFRYFQDGKPETMWNTFCHVQFASCYFYSTEVIQNYYFIFGEAGNSCPWILSVLILKCTSRSYLITGPYDTAFFLSKVSSRHHQLSSIISSYWVRIYGEGLWYNLHLVQTAYELIGLVRWVI